MNLLIVSHTPHYKKDDYYVGWGPTVREIDYLSQVFENVVHVAPLHPDLPPQSAIAYESSRVRVRTVPQSGGKRASEKLGILFRAPEYARVIVEEMNQADLIHIRCPANISLIAVLLLALKKNPRMRWVKYAGTWEFENNVPLSYSFQRWLLKNVLKGGIVTVNGEWPGQPSHIHSFLNPCISETELAASRELVRGKVLSDPVRLLYVGRLEAAKGVEQALRIVAALKARGFSIRMDLIGDGPERADFESLASTLSIVDQVEFHGWLSRSAVSPFYERSHFLILPSKTEGWPKVLSEAMAFGVVPVASSVGSIPQYLQRFQTGKTLSTSDTDGFANAVSGYLLNRNIWKKDSENALAAAGSFTYEKYILHLTDLLDITYGEFIAPANRIGISSSLR